MNKRNTPYHLAVVMLFLLTACKKNFSPGTGENDKLVVLAEITAGDSVEVPIGQTIKVGGGNLIRFEKVNDAAVSLTEDGVRTWKLQPNSSSQFGTNPTTVFTSRRRFRAGSQYAIKVVHPSLGTATSSTHIPAMPRMVAMDTASEVYRGKNVFSVVITWQDDPGGDNYYIIEAVKELVKINHPAGDTVPLNKFVRLNLYTQDRNAQNDQIDNPDNPFRRIFFTGAHFSGQAYSTQVFIDRQFFTSQDPKQKGRVRIQLKSVSKELYDYLLLYEKYKTDFGSVPTSQLSSPVGNIQNGLGVFGGSARRERIFYFDSF